MATQLKIQTLAGGGASNHSGSVDPLYMMTPNNIPTGQPNHHPPDSSLDQPQGGHTNQAYQPSVVSAHGGSSTNVSVNHSSGTGRSASTGGESNARTGTARPLPAPRANSTTSSTDNLISPTRSETTAITDTIEELDQVEEKELDVAV